MSAATIPSFGYTLADIEADPLAVLRVIMAGAPILTTEGWGHDGLAVARDPGAARAAMLTPWGVEQFIRAAQWLDLVPPRVTVNRDTTSYSWKHVAEGRQERRGAIGRGYISNGMFLAGCLATGRRIEPRHRSPNAYVAIPNSAARMP